MKMSNWIFGLVGLTALPIAVLGAQGYSQILFLWPGLSGFAFVPICLTMLVLQAHGLEGIAGAYRAAIKGGTLAECRRSRAVFKHIKQTTYLVALLGVVFGLIMMLGNSSNDGTIVGNLAIALICGLYSLVFVVFNVTIKS